MKTKALVLGAHPPFEGPWVSLEGSEEWKVKVVGGDEEAVQIKFRGNGKPTKRLLFGKKRIRAADVRAVLSSSVNGDSITVYIESVEK